MKKVLSIIAILFTVCLFNAQSQIRWPFGNVNEVTVTVDDTITVTTLTRGMNYIDMATDTNIVLNVNVNNLKNGDLLIIEATESGVDADTIRYGTGITGLYDAIPSDKTIISTFIYTDSDSTFKKVSSVRID